MPAPGQILADYTGRRFGRLVVEAIAGRDKKRQTLWRCKCDCGGERITTSSPLLKGRTFSCGCAVLDQLAKVRAAKPNAGLSKTAMYGVWLSMIGRCHNAKDKDFRNYGARGITVCERWRESFAAFRADMGERPKNAQIERENNDRGYEPGNCVWADLITQANNKRTSRRLEHAGRTRTVGQWAREVGINPVTLYSRLDAGWSAARALTQPVKKDSRHV